MRGLSPGLHVTLHVDPLTIHTWSVLCGLSMLASEKSIRLDVRDLGFDDEVYTLMLLVHDRSSGTRTSVSLAVGDAGRSDRTRRESMADLSFRRSARDGDGTIPLGMLVGAVSGKEPTKSYLGSTLHRAIRRRSLTGARRTLSALSPKARFPSIGEYEQGAAMRGSGKVFFQPRAWDPKDGGDPGDRESVNEHRARLIRVLRAELGPRFIGGFVPSDYARANYGDLLSTESSERSHYLKRLRNADIGISSIGLHGSTPFKIPEYLAAGRAILSEPLRFQVGPDPGLAVSTFESVADCIGQLDALLSDQTALAERQDAALAYWKQHVRPDQVMARMLRKVQEAIR